MWIRDGSICNDKERSNNDKCECNVKMWCKDFDWQM